jgi:hypothetical protein
MDERTATILETAHSLPERSVTATLRNPRGSSTRTFGGALLFDYARATGLTPAPPSRGFGNYYFVATAEDGFTVSLAYFEVSPRATDKQVILAYEQDGEPIRAGVRLIVPDDDLGGRSITGVVDIRLAQVDSVEPQETRPPAEFLAIGGLVERPAKLRLEDLSRFRTRAVQTLPTPRHGGVVAPPRSCSGVLLWDLVEAAVPRLDPGVNEDILRRLIVARGTDGYAAAIAPGEIEPRFMAGEALVATACDGQPLTGPGGRFRLVVPYDKAVGRAIKSLETIEVIEA